MNASCIRCHQSLVYCTRVTGTALDSADPCVKWSTSVIVQMLPNHDDPLWVHNYSLVTHCMATELGACQYSVFSQQMTPPILALIVRVKHRKIWATREEDERIWSHADKEHEEIDTKWCHYSSYGNDDVESTVENRDVWVQSAICLAAMYSHAYQQCC